MSSCWSQQPDEYQQYFKKLQENYQILVEEFTKDIKFGGISQAKLLRMRYSREDHLNFLVNAGKQIYAFNGIRQQLSQLMKIIKAGGVIASSDIIQKLLKVIENVIEYCSQTTTTQIVEKFVGIINVNEIVRADLITTFHRVLLKYSTKYLLKINTFYIIEATYNDLEIMIQYLEFCERLLSGFNIKDFGVFKRLMEGFVKRIQKFCSKIKRCSKLFYLTMDKISGCLAALITQINLVNDENNKIALCDPNFLQLLVNYSALAKKPQILDKWVEFQAVNKSYDVILLNILQKVYENHISLAPHLKIDFLFDDEGFLRQFQARYLKQHKFNHINKVYLKQLEGTKFVTLTLTEICLHLDQDEKKNVLCFLLQTFFFQHVKFMLLDKQLQVFARQLIQIVNSPQLPEEYLDNLVNSIPILSKENMYRLNI